MHWYTAHLLTIITFLPLLGAVVIAFLGRERTSSIRWVALLFSLLTFLITVCLYSRFSPQRAGMQFEEMRPWINLPPVNYHLGVDGLSALMILLTGFLTPLSVLVSWKSITQRNKEFFIFLLALETGMMGVFASLDMILFFVFWEVMLIPMYFLIGIWGHERRVYAAIKFVLFTMVGSALMLTGIIYLYNLTRTFDLPRILDYLGWAAISPVAERWLFLAFFIAFAIKVPLFPFHTWLPDAHVEAPTAGSVILAGVLLIRARNFVKSAQMPYHTQTDRDYDVGDFEGAMRACLAKADVAGFGARAEEARKRGLIRGLGMSSYIECTAWGEGEEGSLALDKNGDFTLLIGTQSNGQGHETAYAQVVSQYLDVPLERVKVVQGDTDRVASGNGTGGSRSIPVGAVMTARASQTLAASLKELAADKLEAAVADLEIADGHIRIAGTDRAISYAEIAALPAATAQKLTAIGSFEPPNATYPNGTHICEVEIDPETGATRIVRYTVVDDFGATLNPLLLAGLVHGGIAQGVGQALMERAVYDESGQLLTASFMDYCMPRADDLPNFDFETRNIPSTTNPLGFKGAGEAGSIGSTPAVMNAVDCWPRVSGTRSATRSRPIPSKKPALVANCSRPLDCVSAAALT